MYLMAAFSVLILLFLILVAIFNGIHLVAAFFALMVLILMGGLAGKALSVNSTLINTVYGIVDNPIITLIFVTLCLVGTMFSFGGNIEKWGVVIGLVIFAVMMVSLPHFIKHGMVARLMAWFISKKMFMGKDIVVSDLGFIVIGFVFYVFAIVLSAYKIDHN